MSLAATIARQVSRHGAPFTIRRATVAAGANDWTEGSETLAYHDCKARARGFKPHEIRGGIQQGDVLVVIEAATSETVPLAGDRIARGTFTADGSAEWLQIIAIDPPEAGGTVLLYRCQCRK